MDTERTVLVLTGADDPTADAVISEVTRRGITVSRHDLGDFPAHAQFVAIHGKDGWSGRIVGSATTTNLDDVGAVYYRRPSRFTFPPGMSAADLAYAEAEARLGIGGVLAALSCRWVNHPHNIARAEWKPLQLETARRCGLTTPRTIISNNLLEATAFAEYIDGPIVCKTLSSITLAERGRHKITYTTLVDPSNIDDASFSVTANLLQEWVLKAREARVTMVGETALGVAIEADSRRAHIDWRSDYDSLRYLPVDVPAEVLIGMCAYLSDFGLSYGAFDFVITPDDEWVMLECNPSGQWLWLHHFADLPIPAALADLLTGGAP